MLDDNVATKILKAVSEKPRSIDEIAKLIGRNWRTADRYLQKIAVKEGSIAIRTFREGTRGALKVAYWNPLDQAHSSVFQEKLLKQIEVGRTKYDFSPLDIYQYADAKKRKAFVEERKEHTDVVVQRLVDVVSKANKQLLIFSGNLSWANLKTKSSQEFLDVLERLARKKVSIKILADIDFASTSNLNKVLEVNHKLGKEVFEVRHAKQPLRAYIIDNTIARFKETRDTEGRKDGLKKKIFIFYEIYDREWVEWLQKVFWNFFRTGVSADKRIKDIKSIVKLG
ncbi:MAG: hypothetical protein AABX59_00915 [Nanoarchaeota archaeon]